MTQEHESAKLLMTLGESPIFLGEQYVRRPEEEVVRAKIEAGQERLIKFPIVEHVSNGVVGIGKTTLLEKLVSDYSAVGEETLARPTVATLVDLGDAIELDDRGRIAYVMNTISSQLNAQLPEENGLSEIDPETIDVEKLGDSVEQWVVPISNISERYLPVFAFDNSHVLGEEDLETLQAFIEKTFLKNLIDENRYSQSLFVFAGDKYVPWVDFRVRGSLALNEEENRHKPTALSPFDGEQTRLQLEKLYPDITEEEIDLVTHLGAGHPAANKELMTLIRKRGGQVDQEFGDLAFTRVVEPMLKNVPEDLRALLTSVTHLRKFNANPLKRFTVGVLGQEYEEKAGVFYLDAIREMCESGLVGCSLVGEVYVVTPTMRKVADRNLMVRDPAAYIERHTQAADMYGAWLEEHPRNGAGIIIERTYHQAQVLNARGLSQEGVATAFSQGLEVVETSLLATAKSDQAKTGVRVELQDIAEYLLEELDKDTELLTETLEPEIAEKVKEIARNWLQQLN